MFLIAVQPPFLTIQCNSIYLALHPLLPCLMFVPPISPFAVIGTPNAPPSSLAQVLSAPNPTHPTHLAPTRHARVVATPIPSINCAQFPSHRGVGRCAPSDSSSLTLSPSARSRHRRSRLCLALCLLPLFLAPSLHAQSPRKVVIDQDAAGPGGTDMQSILALINSPETDVLGITVLTGDAWRDEEVLHTLRLLEIIGRTDIPVVPGAVFPLVSSKEYIAKWETLYGKVVYQGAWNFGHRNAVHGPYEIPPMPEGAPTTKPANEDAAHFLVRMVHLYPHEVTIYAAGPMTDLALAIALDPHFPELAKELIVMGGSINPQSDDPEFKLSPKREFNFWMDPEATHAVLHAHWPRLVLTTVDISIKTRMEKSLIAEIANSKTPAAQYVVKYAEPNFLWDELAAVAWLDPSIITKSEKLYVGVNVDHGAGYGDTLVWAPGNQPAMGEALADVQQDLDKQKFYKEYVDLLTRPTPPPRPR
ncbi:MAG TPA: nucleoside hydrolase [Candidatus Acidoferrum sp.]|nr:nucleoside hydrolase [Candidatus Acidoferrum sp.]